MKIENKNMRLFILPLGLVFGAVVLFVLVVPYGIRTIRSQTSELQEVNAEIVQLEEKVEILKMLENESLEQTNSALVVLPAKHTGAAIISQIKTVAAQNSVAVGGFDVSGNTVEGVSNLMVKWTAASPDVLLIVNMIKELSKSAPISTVSEVTFSSSREGVFIADVDSSTYWSTLPTTFPSLTAPVSQLSEEELRLLEEIESYKAPQFDSLLPADPIDRGDPFN